MGIFTSSSTDKPTIKFIAESLANVSATEFFASDRFARVWSMIDDGKDIAAAKEFHNQTGAMLSTCHFCVGLMKSLQAERV